MKARSVLESATVLCRFSPAMPRRTSHLKTLENWRSVRPVSKRGQPPPDRRLVTSPAAPCWEVSTVRTWMTLALARN